VRQRELDLGVSHAWPPREEVRIGPWRARIDLGVTRRANSVLPHGEGARPSAAAIDALLQQTIALYDSRGLTPWLQLTGASWPRDLELELGARGWQTGIDPTLLLQGPLPGRNPVADVRITQAPERAWIDAWWTVERRGDVQARAAAVGILERVPAPVAFASVATEGTTAGVGLGAVVRHTLVIECVATLPAARRRGHARSIAGALGAWGREHGATRAVLAVQQKNAEARALYATLGFAEAGAYTYARPPDRADRGRDDAGRPLQG
jgi:ribosomal protein S18 acetylase RimI-like enzyme